MSQELSHDNILTHISAILDAGTVAQAQIGRETGLTASTISQVLNGKYKADDSAIREKLLKWVVSHESRNALTSTSAYAQLSDWVATPNSKKIYNTLLVAQGTNDMVAVFGAPGVGKTRTARHYQTQNNNVWLVQLSPDCVRPRAMLEEIALSMGINDIAYSASGLRRQIEHALRGTGGLLIIDEAQYGGTECFEALRSLYDHTNTGIGVIGNMLVHSKLTGGSTQKSQMDAAQRYSRIGAKLKLSGCSTKEIGAILAAWGVNDTDVQSKLTEIATKPGGLRTVEKVMRQALLIQPDKTLGAFTHSEISLAWAMHGGQAGE